MILVWELGEYQKIEEKIKTASATLINTLFTSPCSHDCLIFSGTTPTSTSKQVLRKLTSKDPIDIVTRYTTSFLVYQFLQSHISHLPTCSIATGKIKLYWYHLYCWIQSVILTLYRHICSLTPCTDLQKVIHRNSCLFFAPKLFRQAVIAPNRRLVTLAPHVTVHEET